MTSERTTPAFAGIIPPMVTPLLNPATLDHEALSRLVEHLLGGGIHGLFLLGTTGEGPSLGTALRRELVAAACRQVAGRVPVLVGVTDTALEESAALARYSAEVGAAAVVVAPPPYFKTSPEELLAYLRKLARVSPLPVLVYNLPLHTGVFIAAETVAACAEIPGLVGLKDSSGDMIHFHDVRRRLADRPDFAVLVGPEELLAESILLGGDGGVCGGANLEPALYVALYEAAQAGELARVRALHARVIALSTQLYTVGRTGASMLQGLKCALALRGLCRDVLAPPYAAFGPAERALVAERMAALELLEPSSA